MKELTDNEFHGTFGESMEPVEFDMNLLGLDTPGSIELTTARRSYKSIGLPYEHHLIETITKNIHFVFVKNLLTNEVDWHLLDLNEKYGIS